MTSSLRISYGFSAINRSLKPFLLGKGVRFIVSIAVLLLLARYLPETEYAVYISLQALIAIVGAVSSVGVQQAMLRYIPELRASGNNHVMYWFFIRGMLIRVGLVSLVLIAGVPLAYLYGDRFGLEAWLWILPWYAVVGVFRLAAMSLSQSLEALLWQKQAQYGMAIGGFIRLLGIILYLFYSELDVWAVVKIELISETTSVLIMLAGWQIKKAKETNSGNPQWWRENRKRVYKFGAWSGLLNQTSLLYGSAPNRLITAHYLGAEELAMFGFADSINNLVGRMMPTKMMMSLIRPIFFAHYSEKQDFNQLASLSNLVYRLNLTLLALPIVLLIVIGEPVINWLTADKYGASAYLLAGFLTLMLTEGMRTTLSLLVQAVEKNHILLTNLIQSASLFIAIPLFPYLGLWALIVVNIIGTVVSNFAVVFLLRKYGHELHFDFGLNVLIILYAVISGLAGYWSLQLLNSYVLSSCVTAVVYGLCFILKMPLWPSEMNLFKNILSNQLSKKRA